MLKLKININNQYNIAVLCLKAMPIVQALGKEALYERCREQGLQVAPSSIKNVTVYSIEEI